MKIYGVKCKVLLHNLSSMRQSQKGQGLLIHEVSGCDAPQSVGLLWASDQLVAETSTWQQTQNPQQTNVQSPGGIRTHNLSRRADADLRPTPRGHWHRHITLLRNSRATCFGLKYKEKDYQSKLGYQVRVNMQIIWDSKFARWWLFIRKPKHAAHYSYIFSYDWRPYPLRSAPHATAGQYALSDTAWTHKWQPPNTLHCVRMKAW